MSEIQLGIRFHIPDTFGFQPIESLPKKSLFTNESSKEMMRSLKQKPLRLQLTLNGIMSRPQGHRISGGLNLRKFLNSLWMQEQHLPPHMDVPMDVPFSELDGFELGLENLLHGSSPFPRLD